MAKRAVRESRPSSISLRWLARRPHTWQTRMLWVLAVTAALLHSVLERESISR